MNLFDGRVLAEAIYAELKRGSGGRKLSLGIISVDAGDVSKKFVEQKKKRGEELGIQVRVYEEGADTSKKLRRRLAELIKKTEHDGFVIQLPLPEGINTQYILNAVPAAKDVDVLSQKSIGALTVGRSPILPPVVGAVKTLLESQNINLAGKKIAIIGAGRLVGRPIALWLLSQNLPFAVLTETSNDFAGELQSADIVISGVGKPRLIRGDMVKNGAILIDAGTSVEDGAIAGDVDRESVESKTGWLAAVPGGVGPLTVAYIFKNLAVLGA